MTRNNHSLCKSFCMGCIAAMILGFGSGAKEARAGGIGTAGDFTAALLPAAAGALTLRHHDSQGRWQLAGSVGTAVATAVVLKYAVHETRPNGGSHSFPSGHSSVAFSAAEFLCKRYGWKWGFPAYAAALFVGYSRVESRQHYTHDVLAGAALGFIAGALFTERRPARSPAAASAGEIPIVSLTYRW
jgi:membrane-associated phospholipid phosphatase